MEEAKRELTEQVREAAGTDDVLADTKSHLNRVKRADKWCERRGEKLFHKTGDGMPTLPEFFEAYYLPTRLTDASADTITKYRFVMRRWESTVGELPIDKITPIVLAKFKESLACSQGRREGQRLAAATVRSYVCHVQFVLDHAGKPGWRNRDAAGILESVPWTRPPKSPRQVPKIVHEDRIEAVYLAAAGMERPNVNGVKPPTWWKALLVVAYTTGLRRRTLFSLQWEDVDWQGRRIIIPPEKTKSGQGLIAPLTDTAMEHLRSIRTDREYIFEGFRRHEFFHRQFHRLQDLACIPRDQHFGLHSIRKTMATRLYEHNPAAAQLALGHSGMDVTIGHYVQSAGIVARAVESLPQPLAFTNGGSQP